MPSYQRRAEIMLPPASPDAPEPHALGEYLYALEIIDCLCLWAIPGAPWLDELVEIAIKLLAPVAQRDRTNYAWARREFLAIMAGLDHHPESVPIPEMYRGVNPPAILRAMARSRRPAPDPVAGRARSGRLGRNDRCWCASGKKYKRCHWRSDTWTRPFDLERPH